MTDKYPLDIPALLKEASEAASRERNPNDRRETLVVLEIDLLADIAQSLQTITSSMRSLEIMAMETQERERNR